MIRSSVWGDDVQIELSNVPAGPRQVCLYVWEDNHNERFNILVNDHTVLDGFQSGSAGMWTRRMRMTEPSTLKMAAISRSMFRPCRPEIVTSGTPRS